MSKLYARRFGSFGESGDIARPGLVAYDLVCLCFVRSVSVSAAAVGLLVFKQLSRLLTREPPVDLGPFLVGPAVPSLGFLLQLRQIRNSPCTQTLPSVQAQFDLRLVETASMLGSVMDLQPIPKISRPPVRRT